MSLCSQTLQSTRAVAVEEAGADGGRAAGSACWESGSALVEGDGSAGCHGLGQDTGHTRSCIPLPTQGSASPARPEKLRGTCGHSGVLQEQTLLSEHHSSAYATYKCTPTTGVRAQKG